MAAGDVLVAAAGIGLGCDEDEEYCPSLEPFFFDEAEAVADHERRLRREQEEAQKEEQRVRAANANKFVHAKILDYDPKQGGRYYNRFFMADFSRFDLDEESPLDPMRHTDRVFIKGDRYAQLDAVNILSVKIASLDVDFPINVYGTVIARDSIDLKCVYLFRREKDHPQLITSKDESLILTGPKRGLVLLGDAYVEIDLKITDDQGQEEELSKGFLTIRGIAGRYLDKSIVESNDLATRLSTMEVTYAVVNKAVEATISVEVIEGEFSGKITASAAGTLNLVLHDSEVAGVMNGNGKGVIQLLPVSVSLDGYLLVTFVDKIGNLKSLGFTPSIKGRVEAGAKVGLTRMLVKVAWSLVEA
ncbi:unnamed protein product [Urochloa decumbens]|uniref:DUF6598 domain-containing protein n=1 Tax=Urochloa decumbens TaxID=240449 RepID=A0ABC9ENF8_9POAL